MKLLKSTSSKKRRGIFVFSPFLIGGLDITTKTKIIAIVTFLAVYGLACLWLGHRNERLEGEAQVAKMEQEYERKESEALRQAERLR